MCRRTPWKYNFCLSQQAPHLAAPPQKKQQQEVGASVGESYEPTYIYIYIRLYVRLYIWEAAPLPFLADRPLWTDWMSDWVGSWIRIRFRFQLPARSPTWPSVNDICGHIGGNRAVQRGADRTVLSVILEPHKDPRPVGSGAPSSQTRAECKWLIRI